MAVSCSKPRIPDAQARCRLRVDAVDKVGNEQCAGHNRIQVPSFLNRTTSS
jgi:hypothetical protein